MAKHSIMPLQITLGTDVGLIPPSICLLIKEDVENGLYMQQWLPKYRELCQNKSRVTVDFNRTARFLLAPRVEKKEGGDGTPRHNKAETKYK